MSTLLSRVSRKAAIHPDASPQYQQLAELTVTSVEYPEDHVSTLESSDHIHVEQDQEVKTQ